MNTRLITNRDIAERQEAIANDFRRSQTTFSIAGVRHLLGNTIIAFGVRIHGRLEERRDTAVLPRRAQTARGI